ncbi:molybdate ABC transporter substrate-binding protein [Tistrella bauzanensis]|uniref:Molybdate ABC transporter substrate-binding protein n=1 Tax=Tistrella arctica TaxID=3133430 RepID=A0ABU9YJS9_9PROT
MKALFAGLVLLLLHLQPSAAADRPLLVFAAASLAEVMADASDGFTRAGGTAPKVSLAGSGTLARQIIAGAPATLFISAHPKWVSEVEKAGLVAETRPYAANRIVLVVPAGSAVPAPADDGDAAIIATIDRVLGKDGRLAIGDPASVPAGQYASDALTSLGIWQRIEPRTAPVENVRVALALVARGEAPAGIVYASDAAAEPGVAVLAALPERLHAPVRYPAALITADGADVSADAAAFLDYLTGPEGAKILRRHGLEPIDR